MVMLSLVPFFAMATASAQTQAPKDAPGPKTKKVMEYGEVKRRVERRFRGKVVNQQLLKRNKPPAYRLRLVKADGRVIDVLVNAATAAVLRVEG